MAAREKSAPAPQNLPQRPNPSSPERGFGPAGSAKQGVQIQFTPDQKVTLAQPRPGGGGKAGTK
jgi:hypothetical protein